MDTVDARRPPHNIQCGFLSLLHRMHFQFEEVLWLVFSIAVNCKARLTRLLLSTNALITGTSTTKQYSSATRATPQTLCVGYVDHTNTIAAFLWPTRCVSPRGAEHCFVAVSRADTGTS